MNSSMTKGYFNIPGGIVSSEANNTADLIQSSGARKNNTVINASCMFAFGVLGNILALVVLKRSKCSQKRKLFYRMVGGLALTDLFGIVATSPVVISAYVAGTWVGGSSLCYYFAFMMVFASTGTLMIVCLMAIERLISIRHPYFYHSRLTRRHATLFLCCSWIVAAVMASLPLLGFGNYILQYPYTWCFLDYYTDDRIHLAFNYLYAVFALMIIGTTVSCNVAVLYTLLSTKLKFSRKRDTNSRQFAGYSKRYAECQMVVLLIGISVVFTSCYLPLMIRILLNQTKLLPFNLRMDLIMIRLASMNQLLDPWVYILLRREVVWRATSTLRKTFSCLCPGKEEIKTTIDPETGRIHCHVISSATLPQQENPSCCVFCLHCMCDPPHLHLRESTMSYDYGRRRSCLSPTSPGRRFTFDQNGSIVRKGLVTCDENRFKDIRGGSFSSQNSSLEVVSQQPSPNKESDPFAQELEKKSTLTNPLLCQTLIENIHGTKL